MKWEYFFALAIASAISAFSLPVEGSEKATPDFFPGGNSEIKSNDPQRAAKAIRKWSDRDAWSGKGDPEKVPYFWDYSKVGQRIFLRVIKRSNFEGSLEVWLMGSGENKFGHYKTYRVAYFSGGPGPKTKQGDLQAPEGFYFISRRALNPGSSYHLSMDLGYPNAYERHHGYTGDYLMIHGSNVSIGCYAMTDASIEQIYTLVTAALDKGQPFVRVHCFPFEMTEENLAEHKESKHHAFWKNLKKGWDWFETHRLPPDVTVEGGLYQFSDSEESPD